MAIELILLMRRAIGHDSEIIHDGGKEGVILSSLKIIYQQVKVVVLHVFFIVVSLTQSVRAIFICQDCQGMQNLSNAESEIRRAF